MKMMRLRKGQHKKAVEDTPNNKEHGEDHAKESRKEGRPKDGRKGSSSS